MQHVNSMWAYMLQNIWKCMTTFVSCTSVFKVYIFSSIYYCFDIALLHTWDMSMELYIYSYSIIEVPNWIKHFDVFCFFFKCAQMYQCKQTSQPLNWITMFGIRWQKVGPGYFAVMLQWFRTIHWLICFLKKGKRP